ncbi:pentatricopeptide repeat-containing protein 2, mitochondrial-like [Tenebrio molitor]|jgi:pentatricopeptide repeat domain-containing protein 2|uniref:pentatricopeptide repeat-containing protein 2, mitochondrial-like n=1 Tax=Tenebrio molitor TaxID=7067 RepID=UPI0036247D4F
MANTLRLTFRSIYLPIRRDVFNFQTPILSQLTRNLYAKTTLGIENFIEQKQHIMRQMENIEERFREKMNTYSEEEAQGMIFTEDLKNMIYLAKNDGDLDLVIKMAKKFNAQNKQLRFGNFVFGPVLMRMFHLHNKPDLAIECFKSPQLTGFFDQLITYQIFLDLLYENGKYEDILSMCQLIKKRQLESAKYPRNVIVLTMAACYKINTDESLKYALDLWKELRDAGHFPMRRATTFCAGLCLNRGKPEVALEMLSDVRKPNYVTIRNIKAQAFAQLGRLEEAIVLLKSVISEDEPGQISHTFSKDVVEAVKSVVSNTDNPEMTLEFSKLENLLVKEGHISDTTLDEHLCSEIQRPPIMNNRQQNRFSRYDSNTNRRFGNVYNRGPSRPGLKDLS